MLAPLSTDVPVLFLNHWLSKDAMEVAKKSGEIYPPKTVYGIKFSQTLSLEEKNVAVLR